MAVTTQQLYDWILTNWSNKISFTKTNSLPASGLFNTIYLLTTNNTFHYWDGTNMLDFGFNLSDIPDRAQSVQSIEERDAITITNRALGKIVSYRDSNLTPITKRFDGNVVEDAVWTDESNWTLLGGNSEDSNAIDEETLAKILASFTHISEEESADGMFNGVDSLSTSILSYTDVVNSTEDMVIEFIVRQSAFQSTEEAQAMLFLSHTALGAITMSNDGLLSIITIAGEEITLSTDLQDDKFHTIKVTTPLYTGESNKYTLDIDDGTEVFTLDVSGLQSPGDTWSDALPVDWYASIGSKSVEDVHEDRFKGAIDKVKVSIGSTVLIDVPDVRSGDNEGVSSDEFFTENVYSISPSKYPHKGSSIILESNKTLEEAIKDGDFGISQEQIEALNKVVDHIADTPIPEPSGVLAASGSNLVIENIITRSAVGSNTRLIKFDVYVTQAIIDNDQWMTVFAEGGNDGNDYDVFTRAAMFSVNGKLGAYYDLKVDGDFVSSYIYDIAESTVGWHTIEFTLSDDLNSTDSTCSIDSSALQVFPASNVPVISYVDYDSNLYINKLEFNSSDIEVKNISYTLNGVTIADIPDIVTGVNNGTGPDATVTNVVAGPNNKDGSTLKYPHKALAVILDSGKSLQKAVDDGDLGLSETNKQELIKSSEHITDTKVVNVGSSYNGIDSITKLNYPSGDTIDWVDTSNDDLVIEIEFKWDSDYVVVPSSKSMPLLGMTIGANTYAHFNYLQYSGAGNETPGGGAGTWLLRSASSGGGSFNDVNAIDVMGSGINILDGEWHKFKVVLSCGTTASFSIDTVELTTANVGYNGAAQWQNACGPSSFGETSLVIMGDTGTGGPSGYFPGEVKNITINTSDVNVVTCVNPFTEELTGGMSVISNTNIADISEEYMKYPHSDEAIIMESGKTLRKAVEDGDIGGGIEDYSGLTDTPSTKIPKKLQKVSDDGTVLEDTPYTYDQLVNVNDIDFSDTSWQVDEERLLVAKKVDSASGNFQGATQLIDIFAPAGIDTDLLDRDGWVDEVKVITGENFRGELGREGQLRALEGGALFRCINSFDGTDGGSNGTATYRRNRGHDVLVPNTNLQDSALVDLLDPSRTGGNTDDGWDLVNNTKVISTVPATLGTWYKETAGYYYFCYDVSGSSYYWARQGTPKAIYRYLSITTHPTLIANLIDHDFKLGQYDDTSDGDNEVSYHDQLYYDESTRIGYVKRTGNLWDLVGGSGGSSSPENPDDYTLWDGVNKVISLDNRDTEKYVIASNTTDLEFSLDTLDGEKKTNKVILLDNETNNTLAINTITFNGTFWKFPLGVKPEGGMASSSKAILELTSYGDDYVLTNWVIIT